MPDPTEPSHWPLCISCNLPGVGRGLGMEGCACNPGILVVGAGDTGTEFSSASRGSRPAWDRGGGGNVCTVRSWTQVQRDFLCSNPASSLSWSDGAGLSMLLQPGVSVLPEETHLSGIFFPTYKYCLLPAPDLELPA